MVLKEKDVYEILLAHNNKEIYSNPKGWVGIASSGEHTNNDDRRKQWRFIQ